MFRWLLRLLGLAGDVADAPAEAAAPPSEPTSQTSETAAPTAPRTGAALPVDPTPVDAPTKGPRIVLAGSGAKKAQWKNLKAPSSTEPAVIQTELRDGLRRIRDTTRHKADRRFVERLLNQVETDQLDLPPFPDVAQELDELLKQTSTDILQIARVVERDPGLVRRVWTHARSAMYSSAPRSLHHAVARVGLDALWRIGMSVCLNDTVFRVDGMQSAAESVRHHGIATAEVAALLGGERRGSLYLGGLLHGVGELIALQVAANPKERPPSHDVLRQVADELGPTLAVLMVHSWKLDNTVVQGVGHFANPDNAPSDASRAARTIRAASIAAHASRLAREGIALESADPVTEIQELGFDAMKALQRADEVYNELYETAAAP